jgi:sugar phosphate permease
MSHDPSLRSSAEPDALSAIVMRKVGWRILPFFFLFYLVNILDRVNVSFAREDMLIDMGMSERIFSLGVGIFYISYFLFEIPSNLLMVRVGARRWICRIGTTWGVISACMLFVHDATSFSRITHGDIRQEIQ